MSFASWLSSCANDTRRHVSPRLRVSVATADVLVFAHGTSDRRTSVHNSSDQYRGVRRKERAFFTTRKEEFVQMQN